MKKYILKFEKDGRVSQFEKYMNKFELKSFESNVGKTNKDGIKMIGVEPVLNAMAI